MTSKSSKRTSLASKEPDIREEWGNAFLLVILYMIQGIPLGLSMGSMPFLMRSNMSYTKIGIFTLAGYPYSFKLFWSPLVDTLHIKSIGRRKSWILPLQALSAIIMIAAGKWTEQKLADGDAVAVTALFFLLVLLAATQDIAVDGWALTLLSKKNVGYAATCQTVGMNIGYFTSFTVFLALNDPGFSSSYLGMTEGGAAVTLSGYMKFWGYIYLIVTLLIAVFKPENGAKGFGRAPTIPSTISTVGGSILQKDASRDDCDNGNDGDGNDDDDDAQYRTNTPRRSLRLKAKAVSPSSLHRFPKDTTTTNNDTNNNDDGNNSNAVVKTPWRSIKKKDDTSKREVVVVEQEEQEQEEDIKQAYIQLWRVIKLPSVRLLAIMLIVCRLGMLPAESAAPLKLLEKGTSKEALAGLVMVEFPIELISALIAGRWAASSHPLRPWLAGYKLRLALAGATTLAVAYFPRDAASLTDAPYAFAALACIGVATSFASTLMFTALGDFYNRISDPAMGGAYLTLLNTLANIGVVMPKLGIFALIDFFTSRVCVDVRSAMADAKCGPASAAGAADGSCTAVNGTCVVVRDGFYVLSYGCVFGGLLMLLWLMAVLKKLEALPSSAWRACTLTEERKKRTTTTSPRIKKNE